MKDLRESQYQSILEAISSPIVVTDLDKKVLYLNASAKKLLGSSAEVFLGIPCENMPGCPLRQGERCCIDRLLHGEDTDDVSIPSGSRFRFNASCFFDENNNAAGYILAGTDVRDLQEKQTTLKKSEEMFRIALAQTPVHVWNYDIKNRTLYFPRQHIKNTARRFGLPTSLTNIPDSLLATGMIDEDSMDTLKVLYACVHRGDQTVKRELHLHDPSGMPHIIYVSCQVTYDEAGQPENAVCITQDITAERERNLRYWQESQYRALLTADALYTYEINLTRDKILKVNSKHNPPTYMQKGETYSKAMAKEIEQSVYPMHRTGLYEAMHPNALIDAFNTGNRCMEYEYLRKGAEDNYIWVNSHANIIQLPKHEVGAFIYIRDIDEQKKLERTLQNKAERDPLTGLYNRIAAKTRVNLFLLSTYTEEKRCAMLMIDVDDFKRINDTYGHACGDKVLRDIAHAIRKVFRREDIVSRIGGDEFCVFLMSIENHALAVRKSEEICAAVRDLYAHDPNLSYLSASVGIAFSPEHGYSFDTLYANADKALYKAKRSGKNTHAVYQPEEQA